MSQQILSTDSEALALQKQHYHDLIVNNLADRPGNWREDDELAHIEDTDLYPVIRDGQLVYVTYNNIKPEEHRAAFVSAFYPCEWEVVY